MGVGIHNNETRVWIKSSFIEDTNGTATDVLKPFARSRVLTAQLDKVQTVIVRTVETWDWKLGVLVENSVQSGVLVKLLDDTTHRPIGEAIRLPADAMRKKKVLLANNYPKARDGTLQCPDDLISLTHLHEPAVIECLVHRYNQDLIYTYTGPILLALNPFHNLKDLYSDSTMKLYWHNAEANSIEDLPPHVYAVADASFRGMMRKLEMSKEETPTGCDQSILVSGESGAGKTVTMKFAMKYLAALSQRLADFQKRTGKPGYLGLGKSRRGAHTVQGKTTTDPLALRGCTFNVKSQMTAYPPISRSQNSKQGESLASASTLTDLTDSIENQVLQSNPILESFGNARTLRNDNSSRFGKFIELQFTRYGKLVGAQIQVYLLEKVRLVHQAENERNFHIFFEFLSGGMDFRELKNYHLASKNTPADFKICNSGTSDRRDGVPDSDTYRELRRAMNIMKFSSEVQSNIFSVTAAILHASNLTWVEKSGAESGVDESNGHLPAVCDLLSVTPEDMTQSLCYFSITVGRDTKVRKSLSKEKAEHGFEALLKALYGALFTYLVTRINDSISYNRPSNVGEKAVHPLHTPASFIGILDIFGFESFKENSFEQLCINYCNETLQMQFSSFILKNEQKEYEKENIKWDFIDFSENQDVLDLIEKKGSGILSILDDMCRTPGATDRTFVDTLYKNCAGSSCFKGNNKLSAVFKFTIDHYAGPVTYSGDSFVEKNRDELPKESTEFLLKSPNEFVQELARIIQGSVNVAGGEKNRKLSKTVGGHFKDQLKQLRSKVENTSPSYIRCLKPNDFLVPNRFETPIVAEQLRCGGVLEAVRVARAGFPQHYPHDDFVRRYRPLVWREWKKNVVGSSSNRKDLCRNLIEILFQKLQQLEGTEKKAKGVDAGHGGSFVKLGMQMGKSKVFLRQREFEGLERQRGHELRKAAIKVNATLRGYLVRCKWAEYVPLLQRQRSDFLRDKERRLLEEKEEQARMEQSLSDLASKFSGSSDLLRNSTNRDMVASKVGTRNPKSRADLLKEGPRGSFKWVEKNGAWSKRYLTEIDESLQSASMDDSRSERWNTERWK